jgi:hypothetical protein
MAADAVSALAFGHHTPVVEEPVIARGAHTWPHEELAFGGKAILLT